MPDRATDLAATVRQWVATGEGRVALAELERRAAALEKIKAHIEQRGERSDLGLIALLAREALTEETQP